MTDAEIELCRSNGALLRGLIARDVKLKRDGQEWKGLCPFHNEKTGSFTVYRDGHYHCFGCGSHGTVFDYVMACHHVDFREAVNRVAQEAGLPPSQPSRDRQSRRPAPPRPPSGNGHGNGNGNGHGHGELWQPILPAPKDSPPSRQQIDCDMLHEYHDAEDRLLCYVRRYEASGDKRKTFLPLTYGILNGKRGWHSRAPDQPRPLYRLNALSHAETDATVLLCEGEKAAEAAQRLFPDHVGLSWMGGVNGDGYADLTPLSGRRVILWGDADNVGADAVERLAGRLAALRPAPQISRVVTSGLPLGFDAADLEVERSEDPEAWLRQRIHTPDLHDGWPEPVDFEILRTSGAKPLGAEHMPEALWPYIRDIAERLGAATASVGLAAIVSAASLISEQWQIQPKQNDTDWREGARLWGAIVGAPSVLKSPVIRRCTAPIEKLQVQAFGDWKQLMIDYKAKLKAWKAAVKNDPDTADPEPTKPRWQRYLVEDTTIPALSEVMRDDEEATMAAPLGKVLVRADELEELLAKLDNRNENNAAGDRGAYLRLNDGGPYTIDRIARGHFTVPSWSGCLLGGIQPEVIQRIAADAADNGMLQRFDFAVPPRDRQEIDRAPDHAARELYHNVLTALSTLRPRRTVDDRLEPVVLHRDAHGAREDVNALIQEIVAMDISSRVSSAVYKWPGRFGRLCLTFHLIEVAAARVSGQVGPYPGVVSAATAERVRRYMREILAPHLLAADAVMFNTPETDHCAWVAGFILRNRLERISLREVVQHRKALRSPEAKGRLYSVMASLCVFGWLEAKDETNSARPPSAWAVNPRVHEAYAERAEIERERVAAARATMLAAMARAP